MIRIRGLKKRLGRKQVLDGIDLDIDKGETLVVLGPSGTGKSVLLKTTLGLITPDRGDVRIDGQSVFFGSRRELGRIRRQVGYVFQNAALFDSMSVYENVAQGIGERELKTLDRREVISRVADALEHVNLEPVNVMNKLPAELSGGVCRPDRTRERGTKPASMRDQRFTLTTGSPMATPKCVVHPAKSR